MTKTNIISITIAIGLSFAMLLAEPNEKFKVFLCFGQSNMSGGAGVNPEQQDMQTHDRVMTLAFNDCAQNQWQKDKWYDAKEPLHCGDGVNAMGPAYAFGKVLADSLPDDTIGLIPCGQWGVAISMFEKGGYYTGANKPGYPGGNNVYDWMVNRCRIAQERGVISGIILHQGEANSGDQSWPDKIESLYENLKADLDLESDIPLVAGELLYSGCCGGHNTVVAKIPEKLPLGYVASAQGLSGGGSLPQYHFNQAGYRETGKRFAIEMLKGLRQIETKITEKKVSRIISTHNHLGRDIKLYSLDGKRINKKTSANLQTAKITAGIYIAGPQTSGKQARLLLFPAQ